MTGVVIAGVSGGADSRIDAYLGDTISMACHVVENRHTCFLTGRIFLLMV
jgi:hypothetical protein